MNNKAKSKTPGIVYLSRIPRGMNVKRIREELAEFGEIGNVFLNANGKNKIFSFCFFQSITELHTVHTCACVYVSFETVIDR